MGFLKCIWVLSRKRLINNLISRSNLNRYLSSVLIHPSAKELLNTYVQNPSLLIKEDPLLLQLVNKRIEYEKEIEKLSLLNETDGEMKKLIDEESETYYKFIEDVEKEILLQFMPPSENRDVALEVTAGVGGKEAMHFASELFEMYSRYCIFKGWNWELHDMDVPESGGIRHASAFVSGKDVFSNLSQESGVHRVQRVPATEKSGRVHTSTVTVAVLPQPHDIEVVINDKDVKIETKTSSGAGGQHVNKTESCVRITHVPTGIVIENQTDRSQIRNKQIALQRLRLKLYQMQLAGIHSKTIASRKEQVGTSGRSEKVRTYNYNQDRVTDHRIGVSLHNLDGFLGGGKDLDNLIDNLTGHHREQQLLHNIESKLKELKKHISS